MSVICMNVWKIKIDLVKINEFFCEVLYTIARVASIINWPNFDPFNHPFLFSSGCSLEKGAARIPAVIVVIIRIYMG